jgi:hypothetical protein
MSYRHNRLLFGVSIAIFSRLDMLHALRPMWTLGENDEVSKKEGDPVA